MNEIFYNVDLPHGVDCTKTDSHGHDVTNINNSIDIHANTGNNTGSGNSGDITIIIGIINKIKHDPPGQCDEWVELYNPTNQAISLKNWKVVDNSGSARKINANKTIAAHGFALLAKSNSTFSRYWTIPSGVPVIELGHMIGNGLGNHGDHVTLINPQGQTVDVISWGNDAAIPHFAGTVDPGHSIERTTPGFDTDSGGDFMDEANPTPGS